MGYSTPCSVLCCLLHICIFTQLPFHLAIQYGIACILNICILFTLYIVCTTEIVSSMLVLSFFVRVVIALNNRSMTYMHVHISTFDFFNLLVSQFHVCPCSGLNDFLFQNLTFHLSWHRPIIEWSVTLETMPVMAIATMFVLAVPIKTALVMILVMLN